MRRSLFWFTLAIFAVLFGRAALCDTLSIYPGTGEGDPFGGPITFMTDANGDFEGEYINTTGRPILDLHFMLNPGDRFLGPMSSLFSESTGNDAGTELNLYAGTSPGIAVNQVFTVTTGGIALDNTSIRMTPTFTGRQPMPEPSSLALLAAGLFALHVRRRSRRGAQSGLRAIRNSMFAFMALSAAVSPLALAQVPVVPASDNPVGVPIKPATMKMPLVQGFQIYNPKTKKYVSLFARINDLAAIMKGAMPPETKAEASQRKAQAVADAMNKAIASAILAGKLPAGTPMITVGTAPAMVGATNLLGQPINAKGQPIPPFPGPQKMVPNAIAGYGVLQFPAGTLFATSPSNRDPTGEPRTGAATGMPAGNRGTPASGGMYGPRGSLDGPATGDDGTGTKTPSVVAFGIYEPQALDTGCPAFSSDPGDLAALALPAARSCTGNFIVSVNPTAGENDEQVLSTLAAEFNTDFSADGLSATFNLGSDTLLLDQPIYGPVSLFVENTDSGLDFEPILGSIPEPSSALLLAAALAGLGVLRRNGAPA